MNYVDYLESSNFGELHMPSFYEPSDQVFTFELTVKKDGETFIEKHSFSWPASDEGQLEFAEILSSKKTPKEKLSNLRGRTRYQNYRDADGRIQAAYQLWYDENTPKEFLFKEQNKEKNSTDGDAYSQKFFRNGNIEEILFEKNKEGRCLNGPKDEPAETRCYENGQVKEIIYRGSNRSKRGYDKKNGPNGEPGHQKYAEDGKPTFLESFDYDDNNKRIDREDGLPALREFNEKGECFHELYISGNGSKGYKEITRDKTGQIILLSYLNDHENLITLTDRRQMALLGIDEHGKIQISKDFLKEKLKITMLPAASDSKNLLSSTQQAPIKSLQEHYKNN